VAVRLDENFFPQYHLGRGLLGLMAILLTFLWTVDATQTDPFGVSAVEDFDRITVKHRDNEGGKIDGPNFSTTVWFCEASST